MATLDESWPPWAITLSTKRVVKPEMKAMGIQTPGDAKTKRQKNFELVFKLSKNIFIILDQIDRAMG